MQSTRALVDSSVFLWNPISETSFQLERIGFYTVDVDTTLPINWKDDSNSKLTLPDTTVGKSVVVTVKECDAARQLWGFKSSEAPLTCRYVCLRRSMSKIELDLGLGLWLVLYTGGPESGQPRFRPRSEDGCLGAMASSLYWWHLVLCRVVH